MGWTDDRIATLKKLWLDGLSASQIARTLGGVTRNAVVGKVHRLGLSGRVGGDGGFKRPAPSPPTRIAQAKVATPRAPTQPRLAMHSRGGETPVHKNGLNFRNPGVAPSTGPKAPSMPAQRQEAPGSATVLTLGARMCRWPIGDPAHADFTFCGRQQGETGPYCREHAQVAYQQPQQGKKKTGPTELARSLRRYI